MRIEIVSYQKIPYRKILLNVNRNFIEQRRRYSELKAVVISNKFGIIVYARKTELCIEVIDKKEGQIEKIIDFIQKTFDNHIIRYKCDVECKWIENINNVKAYRF